MRYLCVLSQLLTVHPFINTAGNLLCLTLEVLQCQISSSIYRHTRLTWAYPRWQKRDSKVSPYKNSLLMNIEILLENESVLSNIKWLMLACSMGDRTNHYNRAIKSADWECLKNICIWIWKWSTFQRSTKGRKQMESWVWRVHW